MERGWRTGDPTRGDMAGLRDLMERLERAARGGARALRARRRPGRHPARARRDRGRGAGRRRAPARRGSDLGRRRRRPGRSGPARHAPRRRRPGGSTSSTACPPDIGERIRGLQDYDFLEPDARERFDELVKRLQGQVLDQFVAGMSDAIQSMTPEDLAANREMVRDLNELHPRADRRRRPGRLGVPRQARPVLPGRPDVRRHHRPARPADGGDAVADALDEPGAARRARSR